jgi:hypothetical protein
VQHSRAVWAGIFGGHFGRDFSREDNLNISALVKGTTYLEVQVHAFATF